MKERLTKITIRVSYMLFALFISIALWMFVEITENETIPRVITITNFELKNQELLRSRPGELMVSSIVTESITLTFEAPRNIAGRLSSETVGIVVDLENVISAGSAALNYEVVLPSDISDNSYRITNYSSSQILLLIDRFLEKTVPVEAPYLGGVAAEEDYVVGQTEVFPQTITIRGPEGTVTQINSVLVPIVVSELTATYTDDLGFILIDEQGGEINLDTQTGSMISFDQDTVRVTVPISMKKPVNLRVDLLHGNATNDSNVKVTIVPETIVISGNPNDVRDFHALSLGSIDMTSFGLRYESRFQILLPNDIAYVSGETSATVTIEMLGGLTMGYRSVTNLRAINVPADYSAEIDTQTLDIRLRGTPTALNSVNSTNIWVDVDVSERGTGIHRLPASAYIAGTDAEVDVIGDYYVVVTITELD